MAKLNRQSVPFTQVANAVLNDKTLSLKAKGLFAYLFSKPDGWDFSGDRIVIDSSDGRDSVYAGLKELGEHGYLTRKMVVGRKMEYILKFSVEENPQTRFEEIPKYGKPVLGKIRRVNNKDTNKQREATTNKEFSWEDSKAKMQAQEDSALDIIATFLEQKNLVPKTQLQLTAYIKRYMTTANMIVPFVDKFWEAVEVCKEESKRLNYSWSLETVYKKISK